MTKQLDWEQEKAKWVKTSPQVHPIVLQHLFNQDFEAEQVETILLPDYERGLHDYNLLPDINVATDRIMTAVDDDEKILVFTDYDADGIPGAAVLASFFNKINFKNYALFTPNRNIDGFGLKSQHVEQAIKDKVELIITIDCGSASGPAIQLANENNIDVIVTDHHEVPDLAETEQPIALVNPMRADSKYPYPYICGAMVVFKLVQSIIAVGRENGWLRVKDIGGGWSKWLLDLVAIATVGDMMSLTNENRTATYFGLKVLNQTRNYGLKALIDSSQLERGQINTTDISFRIAPRINAASRMGFGHKALELLTADNPIDAGNLALELEKLNNERRKIVTQMVKVAHKDLGKPDDFTGSVIAIGRVDWLPGTCGLLASRLVEEYGVSAFVWGRGPGVELKGSCRAFGDDNVYQILTAVGNQAFITFGGHVGAGGFVLKNDQAHNLAELLVGAKESLSNKVVVDKKHATAYTDSSIQVTLEDLNMELLRAINVLEPTGRGFLPIQFSLNLDPAIDKVVISQFGKNQEHLKLVISGQLSAIKWRALLTEYNLEVGILSTPISVIGSLEYDSYAKAPRLLVQDIVDGTKT